MSRGDSNPGVRAENGEELDMELMVREGIGGGEKAVLSPSEEDILPGQR